MSNKPTQRDVLDQIANVGEHHPEIEITTFISHATGFKTNKTRRS